MTPSLTILRGAVLGLERQRCGPCGSRGNTHDVRQLVDAALHLLEGGAVVGVEVELLGGSLVVVETRARRREDSGGWEGKRKGREGKKKSSVGQFGGKAMERPKRHDDAGAGSSDARGGAGRAGRARIVPGVSTNVGARECGSSRDAPLSLELIFAPRAAGATLGRWRRR